MMTSSLLLTLLISIKNKRKWEKLKDTTARLTLLYMIRVVFVPKKFLLVFYCKEMTNSFLTTLVVICPKNTLLNLTLESLVKSLILKNKMKRLSKPEILFLWTICSDFNCWTILMQATEWWPWFQIKESSIILFWKILLDIFKID